MHASRILRRCLSSVFDSMHAARARRLLGAVEALIHGRRLTLIDLARSWVGATWVHAPLKGLDRLLGNPHLAAALTALHRAMAEHLLVNAHPLILVDWSDLKGDGRWCLLRAAVPVGGRAMTIHEEIHPLRAINSPAVQARFLVALARVLPAGLVPIMVTDAGFRSDWFRAVLARGWHFIGRIRNNTRVRSEFECAWQPCSALHPRAGASARDLGEWEIVKTKPLSCRLVTVLRARRGRDQCTRLGAPQQSTTAKRSRRSAREPWLLATSLPKETSTATLVVKHYAKRMQIEAAFRDLKSHRYGAGFQDSLSRKPNRLQILLLLHTLACFAAWVMACAAENVSAIFCDPLARQARHRGCYSWYRRGQAWLVRTVLPEPIRQRIRRPSLLTHQFRYAWDSV